MKYLIVLAALAAATATPSLATAADLGGDYDPQNYVEDRRPSPPPRYVDRDYEEEPSAVYYEGRYLRPYRYFAADPYWEPHFRPRYHRWHRAEWRPRYWDDRGRW